MSTVKVGIIGGSGLDDSILLNQRKEKSVSTPFGKPSDALVLGTIQNVNCVFISRHGRKQKTPPSDVNYRANVWALKEEGCTHIIATTSCRSLQGYIHPGEIILIDDFLDKTTSRKQSFYDGTATDFQGICHIPMNEPFSPEIRAILSSSIRSLGYSFHDRGTILTVEGPRLSSWAESRLWREWRADVINMTTVPEVVLAKEAGLLYASLALVTDYDTWRDDHEAAELAVQTFRDVTNRAVKVLLEAVPKLAEADWDEAVTRCQEIVRLSIMESK